MQAFWQEFRFAVRSLQKSPSFTLLAVLTLALGIGANSAILSLVDTILFRPLPISKPGEVVRLLNGNSRGKGAAGFVSFPQYLEYRDHATTFSGLAAYLDRLPVNVSAQRAEAQRVSAGMVTGNYFETLGVNPILGRALNPDDDRVGAPPVMLLGYDFWRKDFLSDANIIGSSILIDGRSFSVIGVTPSGFYGVDFNNTPQVWLPISEGIAIDPLLKSQMPLNQESFRPFGVVGRLQKGVAIPQAQAQLEILAEGWGAGKAVEGDAQDYRRPWPTLIPAGKAATRNRANFSWLVLSIALLVLLIACADAAGLMLARSETRLKEIAIKITMGASRRQVISIYLMEGILLSFLGAMAGCVMAKWGIQLLVASSPPSLPIPLERMASLLDPRILASTILIALFSAVLASLAPALRYSRPDVAGTMKGETHKTSLNRSRVSLRDVLIVVQVGASVLLLIGAGLLTRTLLQASRVHLGFDANHTIGASTDPIRQGYSKNAAAALLDPLLDALRKQPGVQSAAIGSLPTHGGFGTVIQAGEHAATHDEETWTSVIPITPGYFETVGIPVLSGRDFESSDGAISARVAIINQAMAQLDWPNQNPLGKRIEHVGPKEETFEIVGVAGNVTDDLRATSAPRVYFPMAQSYLMFPWQPDLTLLIRASGDRDPSVSTIRAAVNSVDPHLPLFHIRTLEEEVTEMLAESRFIERLLVAFAALATILSAAGVYGLLSYTTERRTREFGIRMALGARPGNVFWNVFQKSVLLTASGLVLGILSAFELTRFVASLLFGVAPADPITFLGVASLMSVTTFAATYLPARRATRVDPTIALRDE